MDNVVRNDLYEILVRFIPPEKWWHRAKWELLKEYTSHNKEVTVPVGFITDGASIPWCFRWRFSPTGRYFGAAIVHDYVLVSEENWKKANREFDKELEAVGVPTGERYVMVFFVNLYSRIKTMLGMKVKA